MTSGRLGARRLLGWAALAVGLGACGSSGHPAVPPPVVTTAPPPSTTTTVTTVPGAQASGPRTVLSPIGLNVRAHPSKSGAVVATAAQGTQLTVLANNGQGWLEVKGPTHTGWISAGPTLSAPGLFSTYTATSNQFGALYPAAWSYAGSPPTVVFRAVPGPDTVVVTTAGRLAALGRGRAGYQQVQSEQIVVCGVTSSLDTYKAVGVPAGGTPTGATAESYLAQVLVSINAHHALGIDANLTDLSGLQTVRDFANSVTFPYPQCQG